VSDSLPLDRHEKEQNSKKYRERESESERERKRERESGREKGERERAMWPHYLSSLIRFTTLNVATACCD
jgi:hypothetical protein